MIKMNTLTKDNKIEAHNTHDINKKNVLENLCQTDFYLSHRECIP